MEQSWREFIKAKARASKRGEIRTGSGIEAIWANSLLMVNNGTFLTGPVTDAGDLLSRSQQAGEDAASHPLPWFFYLYEPLLPATLLPEADRIFAESGYLRAANMAAMATGLNSLAPATRPLPVDIRRISTDEEKLAALALNCIAYGLPLDWSRSAIDCDVYFTDPTSEFGYLAYEQGQPVATGSVLILNHELYIEAMATDPAYRQKGYAEAIIRQALADAFIATGLDQTSLDASDMGRPLYQRMGYQNLNTGWRYYART